MMSLAQRVCALRLSLLQRAAAITEDSSDAEIRRVYARYLYLKRVAVREATEPGEARELLRNLFAEPDFSRFWSIRTQTNSYREWRREYDRRRYERRLKAERTTPEARARLARARRTQRAARRGTSP